MRMSYAEFKATELWGEFMPRRKEITNNLNNELISLAVYTPNHFNLFQPNNEFKRWATVEVSNFDKIPKGMETFILSRGLYAVFNFKGSANSITPFFHYILNEWLPNSNYILDHRPHFEVLDEKYKNNDPSSEEEIWIPIKEK